MNRRQFLKGLLATTAAAAVAPAALAKGTVLTIEDVRRGINILRERQTGWTGRYYTAVLHPNHWNKVLIDKFAPDDVIVENRQICEGTSLVEPTKAAVGHWNGIAFITPVHEEAA